MSPAIVDPSPKIPVVDFGPWHQSQDESARQQVAQELVEACQKVGFAYIVNHSLADSTLDEAFTWVRRFFRLPDEEKMKAPHPEGWAVHRGYSWPGLEKVPKIGNADDEEDLNKKLRDIPDVKEIYDFGGEENPAQPNQWPPEKSLPGYRDFMSKFYLDCRRVGDEILRALAVGLNLEDELYLSKRHSGHNNHMRLLHYLPVPAEELEQERAARCEAHTDWSSITMLFQDDCGGLEVDNLSQPGTFIQATPIKNAIIVNVGDLLQMWSNDRLRSTKHRVREPPLSDRFEGPNRMTRERFSIPYFVCPDPEAVIECIPSCMSEETPAKYEPVTQDEYHRMRVMTLFA